MRAFSTLFALSSSIAALAAPVPRAASANAILALQFARVLEVLESTFYAQALKQFTATDFTNAGYTNPDVIIQQLTAIAGDEATHSTVLEKAILALGAQPLGDTCTFDFSSVLTDLTTTINTARLVEAVGVGAYLGAAPLLDDPELLVTAATILTNEARHSTVHNTLAGGTTISNPFDIALAPSQVLAIAGSFIKGCTLPIAANPTLSMSNTGVVTTGTKLELVSDALNSTSITGNTTCQIMVGGAVSSIALPFDNCVVPDGLDGLAYVYVTKTTQPLLNDLTNQFQADIIAGPMGMHIDTQNNLLAGLIATKAIGLNPAFQVTSGSGSGTPSNSGGTTTTTSAPTTTTTSPSTNTDAGGSTFTSTTTIPAGEASSILSGSTPTATPSGPAGGAVIVGWSSIAATPTPSAPSRRSNYKNRL